MPGIVLELRSTLKTTVTDTDAMQLTAATAIAAPSADNGGTPPPTPVRQAAQRRPPPCLLCIG